MGLMKLLSKFRGKLIHLYFISVFELAEVTDSHVLPVDTVTRFYDMWRFVRFVLADVVPVLVKLIQIFLPN